MVASAKKQQQAEPEAPSKLQEAADKFLVKWDEKYTAARTKAAVATEMTNTEQWQNIYAKGMARRESNRLGVTRDLRQFIDLLDQGREVDEDSLKIAKDAIKAAGEGHAGHNAWWMHNVADLVAAAEAPGKIIDEADREARNQESNNPLTARGLAAAVQDRLKYWRRFKFDRKTGRIEMLDLQD
jgi:hypothetical protein